LKRTQTSKVKKDVKNKKFIGLFEQKKNLAIFKYFSGSSSARLFTCVWDFSFDYDLMFFFAISAMNE
jgi:hypothetical protein